MVLTDFCLESVLHEYIRDEILGLKGPYIRGLPVFEEALSGLPAHLGVRDKLSVLVPGCGVDHSKNYNVFERGYASSPDQKWAGKAALGGWKVTGIDQFEMRAQPKGWNFLQRDLTDAASWEGLPNSPFDLVYCQMLIDLTTENGVSPSLNIGNYQGRAHHPFNSVRFGDSVSSEMPVEEMNPFDQQYVQFVTWFLGQVAKVLKPSGLAIINSQILKLNKDRFETLYSANRRSVLDQISVAL